MIGSPGTKPIWGKKTLVSETMEKLSIVPKTLLEIGCSNGWRLKKLQEKYDCDVYGLDPSAEAIEEAVKSGLDPKRVVLGTIDSIPAKINVFDVVILGFCMCFVAPEDWVLAVSETARVLKDGGHLIIHDYLGARAIRYAFQKVEIENGIQYPIYLYVYDWPSLWLKHPEYKIIHEAHLRDRGRVVSVLKKNFADCFVGEDVR